MTDYIPVGAHLATPRSGYEHHGIYAGCGLVVHYSGLSEGLTGGPIEEVSLERFCNGKTYKILATSNSRFNGADVVHRARSRLGEDNYNLIANNCEHFCQWCINGVKTSKQVRKTLAAAGSFVASRYLVAAGSGALGAASAPVATTLITGVALGYGVNRLLDRLQDD